MDNNLQHYASPYYDPQKAHEYYMRTRELKGRRSATKLSDEGKKVWSYTKNEIKAEKKAKVEGGTGKAKTDYNSAKRKSIGHKGTNLCTSEGVERCSNQKGIS